MSAPWYTTVIVVTHEGPGAQIGRCLSSLVAAGGYDAIVVVDNGVSGITNDTRRYGPGVIGLITMPNLGYGAAANRGSAWAAAHVEAGRRSAVALLNDDIAVRPGWLEPLLDALDADTGLGAVQPKLLLNDTGLVNSVGVCLDRFHAGSDVGYRQPDDARWNEALAIDMFSGGAVLFRAEFLDDVGGFDERYFLYYEDVDLALRGAEKGWRYVCEPSAVVDHGFGSSTAGLGADRRRLQERNRLWTAARFADAATVRNATWLSVRRLAYHPRRAHAAALLAGLGGMAPRIVERRRARARRDGRCRR